MKLEGQIPRGLCAGISSLTFILKVMRTQAMMGRCMVKTPCLNMETVKRARSRARREIYSFFCVFKSWRVPKCLE